MSEEKTQEEEFVLPPEPYPGYYADLERSGLDPVEEMKKKAARAQGKSEKKKKVGGKASMYRSDGTAYAPWMVGAIIEDVDSMGVKSKSDAVGSLRTDPQAQELAGVGLKYKSLGDELLLTWSTGSERSNQGFVIRKRKGKTDEWIKIADFDSHPAELTSKGAQGGDYSWLDKSPEPGTWIYRVSDIDKNGVQSDLSQTIVELQSEGEQRVQIAALIGLIAFLVLFGAVAANIDKLSGL
mmetsp:Transcript_19326/g.77289  ORF Transcript_19326/g.77289 Transcript_19326/m.77289 type:complete len:239 (+) Transcript_19326:407-1123(+)